MKLIKLLIIFFCLLCSCSKQEKEPNEKQSYINAMALLRAKDYEAAAKSFEEIQDINPSSKWATKGRVMAAYSYYRAKEYEETIRIVDNFLPLNPTHNDLPYMLYLKAMAYYQQIPDVNIDQSYGKMAYQTFQELLFRFPDSSYFSDSLKKAQISLNHVAAGLMSIGRYEMLNQNYVGAIKNFNEVIENYPATEQRDEAYFRLAEIYYKIGLKQEASRALEQLTLCCFDSKWINYSYLLKSQFN